MTKKERDRLAVSKQLVPSMNQDRLSVRKKVGEEVKAVGKTRQNRNEIFATKLKFSTYLLAPVYAKQLPVIQLIRESSDA